MRVAIVGGSNSARSSYPAKLRELLGSSDLSVKITNSAMAASGVLLPSFCYSELVQEHVDVLIIESSSNDAITWATDAALSPSAAPQLSPVVGMERLLSQLPAQTRPLIFAVCGPGMTYNKAAMRRCETLHDTTAQYYGVQVLSLQRSYPSDRELFTTSCCGGIHLSQHGNEQAAALLARTIRELRYARLPRAHRRASLPLLYADHTYSYLATTAAGGACSTACVLEFGVCSQFGPGPAQCGAALEAGNSTKLSRVCAKGCTMSPSSSIGGAWTCRTCRQTSSRCDGLTPSSPPVGFGVGLRESHEAAGVAKWGWLSHADAFANAPAPRISFNVSGRVLIGFLCGHDGSVAQAIVSTWPSQRNWSHHLSMAAAGAQGPRRAERVVALDWKLPAEHLCVVEPYPGRVLPAGSVL